MVQLRREAQPAIISDENPMGTDGFEFVEFAHPDPAKLGALFELMGFSAVSRHRSKNVTLYRQGDVNFVLNAEPDSFAADFAKSHGPSACAMGFRVADAADAFRRALAKGAKPVPTHVGPMELNIPAIEAVGGALIYLVDRYGDKGSIWDVDFRWTGERDPKPPGAGLTVIDHLTHNVNRGRMDAVADWYQWIFNFHQIRYFDIEGRFTGLHSRAMTSPCGKISHTDQRERGREQPDRGISPRLPRRRDPAHRLRMSRHLCDRGEAWRRWTGVHAEAGGLLLRQDRPTHPRARRIRRALA